MGLKIFDDNKTLIDIWKERVRLHLYTLKGKGGTESKFNFPLFRLKENCWVKHCSLNKTYRDILWNNNRKSNKVQDTVFRVDMISIDKHDAHSYF